MFLGLALILGALLWARDIRRRAAVRHSLRGPWIMGLAGAVVFVSYLWLVTRSASPS